MSSEPDLEIDFPLFRWGAIVLGFVCVAWLFGIIEAEESSDALLYLVVIAVNAVGVALCGWYNVRSTFYADRFVFERGIWPFRRTMSFRYQNVGRVRVGRNNVTLAVREGASRNLQVAVDSGYPPSGMRLRGERHLPDIAAEDGETASHLQLRRIAKFVEQRAAGAPP
jgi:hypothetical protein